VGESRRADGVVLMAAYVVPAGEPPMPEEVLGWAAEGLAAYKCPKLISFIASLPRSANGKVIRARLPSGEIGFQAISGEVEPLVEGN
jgi:long-chain acyl-CoA synthetase